jgi:Zn-dependent protease
VIAELPAGADACGACGVELAPAMLACPACRKLVHSSRLQRLAAEASAAEGDARLTDALSAWREAMELLPHGSLQRREVGVNVARLSELVDASRAKPPPKPGGGKAAAGLGAVGVVLWQAKYAALSLLGKAKLLAVGLTSLPTLLSMFAWLAIDRSHGIGFGVGLVASIYVHEMGHVFALRAYGIRATAPMFVPGFGALVRLHQYPIDAREDARVGLAGPVWGAAAAVVALAIGLAIGSPTALAVAALGATINVFNLVPVWQLDGARGLRALDARQRGIVVGVASIVALVLGQPIAWGVVVFGALRLKQDLPPKGDRRAFVTFVALLVGLSLVGWWATPAAP